MRPGSIVTSRFVGRSWRGSLDWKGCNRASVLVRPNLGLRDQRDPPDVAAGNGVLPWCRRPGSAHHGKSEPELHQRGCGVTCNRGWGPARGRSPYPLPGGLIGDYPLHGRRPHANFPRNLEDPLVLGTGERGRWLRSPNGKDASWPGAHSRAVKIRRIARIEPGASSGAAARVPGLKGFLTQKSVLN